MFAIFDIRKEEFVSNIWMGALLNRKLAVASDVFAGSLGPRIIAVLRSNEVERLPTIVSISSEDNELS
jgi:hypothetical protein